MKKLMIEGWMRDLKMSVYVPDEVRTIVCKQETKIKILKELGCYKLSKKWCLPFKRVCYEIL